VVIGETGLEVAPSPSPDGIRLALTRTGGDVLFVLDLASGTLLDVGPGHSSAWRPQGDEIAFVTSGEIWAVRPDGSNRRRVSQAGRGYSLGIDWSPDGAWLVAAGGGGLGLIQFATGKTITLAFTAGWVAPSWKPR